MSTKNINDECETAIINGKIIKLALKTPVNGKMMSIIIDRPISDGDATTCLRLPEGKVRRY